MFEHIYRFLNGRVFFTAYEGFQEVFLNVCKQEKLTLMDAVINDTHIVACIRYCDYKKLLRAAAQSGMLLGSVKKSGFPAIIQKYKKRIGIPVGLMLASVILLTLSSMLWSIEVDGLKTINAQDFNTYLEKNGIKTGDFTSNIDCNEIEYLIHGYGENILDATVNLIGCKMFIQVQERAAEDKTDKGKKFCNIVASKDGEIIKADVFAGESLIKPGDVVVKGDILASSLTTTPNGKPYCVEARAQILAKTYFSVSCQTAKRIKVNIINRIKNKYRILIFGIMLPGRPERISSAEYISTDTGVFPLGRIRTAEAETEIKTIELTRQACFLISLTDLSVAAVQHLFDVKVTECSLRTENNGSVCIDAQFSCEEDIAREVYFYAAE